MLLLEESRGWRKPRASEGDRLRLSAQGISIEHGRVLQAPLELPLGAVKVAIVDPGPAKAAELSGRFAVLRRLGPTTVIPRTEGIEGWLWTSVGGTAMTNLGEDDEAPNVALVFTKPLDEDQAPRGLRPGVRDRARRPVTARQPDGARACCSASPTRWPPRTASAAGASSPC